MHRFSRWTQPLMDAQSVADVKGLMAEYIRGILPKDREQLPAAAQEALDVDDIAGSAFALTREEVHYVGDQAVAEALHEIAQTFVAATHRIAAIRARDEHIGKTLP